MSDSNRRRAMEMLDEAAELSQRLRAMQGEINRLRGRMRHLLTKARRLREQKQALERGAVQASLDRQLTIEDALEEDHEAGLNDL